MNLWVLPLFSSEPLSAGTGSQGPPVVLVHGFGASAYHWRYNIPILAANHRVFAVDLLGFGWSDKPLVSGYTDYSVWQDQLASFIQEVHRSFVLQSLCGGPQRRGEKGGIVPFSLLVFGRQGRCVIKTGSVSWMVS